MPVTNSDTAYGNISKFFHWLVALFVIFMLFLGFFMGSAKLPSLQSLLYGIHKSMGLTILGIMILRYIWRLLNPTPKFPAGTPVWQAKVAKWSHGLLYLLLFIMPLSGWLMSTAAGYAPNFWGLVKAPMPWVTHSKAVANIVGDIHHYCAWILVALICIHALGAIEHWLIRKDNVLQRMLPNFMKRKRFYD